VQCRRCYRKRALVKQKAVLLRDWSIDSSYVDFPLSGHPPPFNGITNARHFQYYALIWERRQKPGGDGKKIVSASRSKKAFSIWVSIKQHSLRNLEGEHRYTTFSLWYQRSTGISTCGEHRCDFPIVKSRILWHSMKVFHYQLLSNQLKIQTITFLILVFVLMALHHQVSYN